jgi:hypothetical protein
MKKMNFRVRVMSLTASVALLGGVAFVASGQTGAYFSQTVQGGVTGTVGSIHITPSTTTNISFSNLLPGAAQSVSVNYENTGSSSEDVYLNFNNLTALSALNNLGRFGAVHISSTGFGAVGDVFDSFNLNDNTTTCEQPFVNTPSSGPTSACWPLPNQLLVAHDVASGATGSFTFTFEYASALSTQSGNFTDPWNSFPVAGQFTTNTSDGNGNGLPFQIVATQVGITPGQVGSKF